MAVLYIWDVDIWVNLGCFPTDPAPHGRFHGCGRSQSLRRLRGRKCSPGEPVSAVVNRVSEKVVYHHTVYPKIMSCLFIWFICVLLEKKMVDWCWWCSSILLTQKSCPEWGVIPQIRPLAVATVIPSTGWSSRYCGFRWRFIRPVITSWYPLVMTNVAIENGPFIVDLPTKNVIFNSYVSLPEGRWQTSHDFGWVETPSQIGGAGFRWPIHSRNALAMGEGRSIVNRGTRQLRSL